MNEVLLLDGRAPASLAIARSLGHKGINLDVGDTFSGTITSYSKYVNESFRYTSPGESSEKFINDLLSILKNKNYDMVLPVRDETTKLVSKNKVIINEYTNTYIADYQIIDTLDDKAATIKLANNVGVPTPETYFPEDTPLDEIKSLVDYPVLIRPRNSAGSRGIKKVESEENFESVYNNVEKDYVAPMVQEYIDKSGYSTACILMDVDQNVLGEFSYERIEEYPESGGPTVVGISTDDCEVKKYASDLLSAAEWKGPAEVEFILDRDGTPRLLEVNPRFWTPVHLAVSSGVDFPYLTYQLGMGKEIHPATDYLEGVKYRWVLPNEILLATASKSQLVRFASTTSIRNLSTCYAILSTDDPFPVIGFVAQSLKFLSDKQLRAQVLDRGW